MLKPCVYCRIYGEGVRAAFAEFKESDCRYCGEKKQAWLDGFRSYEKDGD